MQISINSPSHGKADIHAVHVSNYVNQNGAREDSNPASLRNCTSSRRHFYLSSANHATYRPDVIARAHLTLRRIAVRTRDNRQEGHYSVSAKLSTNGYFMSDMLGAESVRPRADFPEE